MTDGVTIISLVCFGIMIINYAWGAVWHVVDSWRYINSDAIDEAEFAYSNYGVKGRRIKATQQYKGRRVVQKPQQTRKPGGKPQPRAGWAYSTML